MRDHKQLSQPDRTSAQPAQTSTPTTQAESVSVDLSTEELEERIAPLKKPYRF